FPQSAEAKLTAIRPARPVSGRAHPRRRYFRRLSETGVFMSKELVISAASHERRVAILEEGQLVEIYIEREKEFALAGSIYKGRVTRVLPGMQSAFVDIGLDGDAFLYVSDVFENLEDYDHGHVPGDPVPAGPPPVGSHVEALPGESLAHAHGSGEEARSANGESSSHELAEAAHEEVHEQALAESDAHDSEHHGEETYAEAPQAAPGNEAVERHDHDVEDDERQPESNASAPQNFAPQYNPTQKYPQRNDRGGQEFRGDRGGQDRGGRGRWGRRGGRRRGGRHQGGPGGRNLPPSKY